MSREKPSSFYTGRGYVKGGRGKYRVLYNEIVRLLPPPKGCPTIIDLGCGVGYFAEIVYKKGYKDYIGIDFSRRMLKNARKNAPNYEYIMLSLYDDTFKEIVADYKLFTILETLEHVKKDVNALQKLPPGSIIIGSVPNTYAQAHVRIFEDIPYVVNRYSEIIDFDFFKVLRLSPGKPKNKVIVFRGIIKDD